jgi:hypothetical protein
MIEKALFVFFCAVLSFGLCQPALSTQAVTAKAPLPKVEKGRDGPGILDLPNGSKFQTTLYDLAVIGQLHTTHKLPYYVLSGIGCDECDANVSIYVHSPSNGPMKDEGTQPRFDYPGRTISREDHTVTSETRVFLGSCAVGHPDAVIWFEHYIGDDHKWHRSVSLAEVKDDRLDVIEPKTDIPTLSEMEAHIRKSQCRELRRGPDQWEEP